ncbi:MAG: hypothetical protein IJW29_02080 [Clostridia bacterium]|nr:hypothetical protein [Clostridia bacterium]
MMDIFGTKTFRMTDSLEEQSVATMKEAAELWQAVRWYERNLVTDPERAADVLMYAIDEGADVIQTVLNAFAMMGMNEEDVEDAMFRCLCRNEIRGRV